MNRKLLIVLFIACLSFGIGIDWGLPEPVNTETTFPWEVDAVAPLPPLLEAHYLFTREGTEYLIYPLFHYMVLDIVYAPYMAFQFFKGNLEKPSSTFPFGLKDPVPFSRNLVLLARLVSLVMGLGIVITVYRISEELFSAAAAFWASLMTALLAPLTYYAKVSNTDVPYLFWSCLAIWQYIRIIKTQRLRNYMVFATCVALAIATKDQAYGFFVLIPWVIIYVLALHNTGGAVGLKDLGCAFLSRPILLSLIVAIAVFAIANNLVFGGWSGFVRHIAFITGQGSQQYRMFPNTVVGQISLILLSKELLVRMFGYGALILCVCGICYSIFKRHWLALSTLLFPLSYFIFVLGVVGYVYTRFLLGPAILLTPFAGALIVYMLEKKKAVRVLAMLGIIMCLLWQVALTVDLSLSLIKDSRYEAESWIKAHIPPGATIEAQGLHERMLPHISQDYRISLKGKNDWDEPLPEELSAETLRARDPQYVFLGSLGFPIDPENWQDASLIEYRDALLGGKLGYNVLAKFETPHFIPYRLIDGTKPTFILLGKSSDLRQLENTGGSFGGS